MANASSGRSVDGNVLEPDQREILGNTKGVRLTDSSRMNSYTDLNRLDETPVNLTVEEGDWLVNEKKIDRQTHAHHIVTGENAAQEAPEILSRHVLTHREPT